MTSPDPADPVDAHAPPAPARETKGVRTRRHLLLTAARLIAERGVEATSVVDVTQAAGVSNGTFYTYFANKEEVVAAVHDLLVTESLRAPSFEDWRPADASTSTALGVPAALALAARDPVLGALTMRAMLPGGLMHAFALDRMVEWCELARQEGHVVPFDPRGNSTLALALMVSGMQMVLDGHPLEPTQRMVTESILVVRGYDREESARMVDRGMELARAAAPEAETR